MAKSVHNTMLNAKRQGATRPKSDGARVARTRLSLGEASGVCGSSNPQRQLDIVSELNEVDRSDPDRYWNNIENTIDLPDRSSESRKSFISILLVSLYSLSD